MKRFILSAMALASLLVMSTPADAKPPKNDRDRHEQQGRHDDRRDDRGRHDDRRPSGPSHDHDRGRGPRDDHRDFGPGHGHQGDHYRHQSPPRRHPIFGSYYSRPGYFGREYYGKRKWHPILGTIYVR